MIVKPVFHYQPSVLGATALAADRSGNKFYGRITAWTQACMTPKGGRRGVTLTPTQYVTFDPRGSLFTRSVTISCWVYLTDTSFQGIFTRDDASSIRQWWMDQYGGNFRVGFFDSSGSYAFNQYPCTLNKWTHLCGTFHGNVAKLYVNGVFRAASTSYYGGGLQAAQQKIVIGRYYNYALPVSNGCVDDCRIYSEAFSAEAVMSLMTGEIDSTEDEESEMLALPPPIPEPVYDFLQPLF